MRMIFRGAALCALLAMTACSLAPVKQSSTFDIGIPGTLQHPHVFASLSPGAITLDDPAHANASTQLNIGVTANDGTGDTLRGGGLKIKQDFADINTMMGEIFGTGGTLNPAMAPPPWFIAEGFTNNGTACPWTTTGDSGACINNAIAAACTNGGGTVLLPALPTISFQVPILQQCSGVTLAGGGIGASGTTFSTQLKWTAGSDPAVPLVAIGPASGQGYAMDFVGVGVDGNNIGNVCVQVANVARSVLKFGAGNCLKTDIFFTTLASGGTLGTQDNDIWVYGNSANSATSVLIDGNAAGGKNVSLNRFHEIQCNYNTGDGVVFGNQDNNRVFDLRCFPSSSTTSTGRPAVVANTAYTLPSGGSWSGLVGIHARELVVDKTHVPFTVLGGQNGATLLAAAANTGTGAVATIGPFTTSGNPKPGQTVLTLTTDPTAGTPAVIPGLVAACKDPSGNLSQTTSGVYENDPVTAVVGTPTNTVTLAQGFAGNNAQPSVVPAGDACSFGFGVQPGASPTNITYSIAAISNAASAVVQLVNSAASNPMKIGQAVLFTGLGGMTQINGLTGLVTAVGGSSGSWTATVNINSSGYSTWTSGGIVTSEYAIYYSTTTTAACPSNSGGAPWCITSAGVVGHAQSGIAEVNDCVSFTDVVFCHTSGGTFNSGDALVLTVPQPAYGVSVRSDANNTVPLAFGENLACIAAGFGSQPSLTVEGCPLYPSVLDGTSVTIGDSQTNPPILFPSSSAPSGAGITALFAAPPPIGTGTPNSGAFTTVTPTVNYVHGVTVLCESGAAVTHTGDTTETNLASCAIPAGIMGTNGALRITAYYSRNATSTDVEDYYARFGTASGIAGSLYITESLLISGVTGGQFQATIRNLNSASAQQAFNNNGAGTGTETAANTTTINTANPTYVNFTCKNATSSADTCGLYGYTVELVSP